jgi:hypothetical protein
MKKPHMTGIGHGEVFTESVEVPDSEAQFVSSEIIGSFAVFGYQMNPTTIYESPYGTVELAWESERGTETATMPIIERDEVYGSYFMVGVPRDDRYDPATLEFFHIEYNDFDIQVSVEAPVSALKSCNNSRDVGATCAPLAPMAAYRLAFRNPFKPVAYYG